jgi:hypothetical protein
MMKIDFSQHFETVVHLWISNEKFATNMLMELSKSCVFSEKKACHLRVVMDC